jgi:hypothetical protein
MVRFVCTRAAAAAAVHILSIDTRRRKEATLGLYSFLNFYDKEE